MDIECTNCQAKLPADANYCSSCGQNTDSYRRPFLELFRETIHELLDIDGRLSLTLKNLLLKPGLAAYEYSQGQRMKFTPPLRLYLVVSLVFFLAFSSFQHIYSNGAATDSNTDHYAKAMFVLFPLFALYVTGLFRQSYFLHNLVFSIHMHCVAYLVMMIIAPLEAFESQSVAFLLLQLPPALYLLWYSFAALKTLFQLSWTMTLIKGGLVYFLYMGTLGVAFDVVLERLIV